MDCRLSTAVETAHFRRSRITHSAVRNCCRGCWRCGNGGRGDRSRTRPSPHCRRPPPTRQALVRREHSARMFVVSRHQLKEERGAGARYREIADLIDDEERRNTEHRYAVLEMPRLLRLLEGPSRDRPTPSQSRVRDRVAHRSRRPQLEPRAPGRGLATRRRCLAVCTRSTAEGCSAIRPAGDSSSGYPSRRRSYHRRP